MNFRLTVAVLGKTLLDVNAGEPAPAIEAAPAPVPPEPAPDDTPTDRRTAPTLGFAAQPACQPYQRPTIR